MFPGIEYIKTCLNGLRSKFDKLEQDTNGKFQASTADWNQNNRNALDYVKNRTHFRSGTYVKKLDSIYLPLPTSDKAGAIKANMADAGDTFPVSIGSDGMLYTRQTIPCFTTSGSGSTYTANVPEINEISTGMLVVMIPHVTSTTAFPTLSINGGPSKYIYKPTPSYATGSNTSGDVVYWLTGGTPVLLQYCNTYWVAISMGGISRSNMQLATTCSTSPELNIKEAVNKKSNAVFDLNEGAIIAVRFTTGNTAENIKIKVVTAKTNYGAYSAVMRDGSPIPADTIKKDNTYFFMLVTIDDLYKWMLIA